MKIKEGFILKRIADDFVVIPSGNNIVDFNNMIVLNETSAFIWKNLENDTSVNEIAEKMTGEFDVDKETAIKDINDFINILDDKGIIEGE